MNANMLDMTLELLSGDTLTLRAPGDTALCALLSALAEEGRITLTDLCDADVITEDGGALDMFLTLAENDVRSGNVLRLIPRSPADLSALAELYGCPSARDLPGLVPPCMLVQGEGAESVIL